jgi:hypothetical protein
MTRKTALNRAGDIVDTIGIHLSRIESLATAIHTGCDEQMSPDKILCLASLAENEAQRAQAELDKWFDGLTGHRQ